MTIDSTDSLSASQLAQLLGMGADADDRRETPPPVPRPLHMLTTRVDDRSDREKGPYAPGDVVDDFEIIEEIGRGGMCIVYKAYQRGLKREVALKALRPSLGRIPALARRFRQESILAGNLSHPSIVPIFAHGVDWAGRPYFMMELVTGMTVGDRVACDGPVTSKVALGVAIAACDALATAHAAGIIHRDVTPRNIILQGDGRVRLVDFGIARDTTGNLAAVTRTTAGSSGTLRFMSPEQNLAHRLDARTDIFSLGMTLYYMVTGSTAYRASNRAELALAFQMQTPRAMSTSRSGTGGRLGRIVMKMIAADPADRYQNCDELAADLAACRAGGGAARRPGGARWARPAVAAALLGVVALGAYALGSLAWPGQAPRGRNVSLNAGPAGASRPADLPCRSGGGRRGQGPPAKLASAGSPKPAGASGAAALPPRAVVQWVYQPHADRGFDDAGALTGQTMLDEGRPLSLGLFLFDASRGLSPYSPRDGAAADFRIEIDDGMVTLCRAAAPDGTGCIVGAGENAFDTAAAPRRGYESLYSHVLTEGATLFFRCARGGHAKVRVVSVR